ncbi:hypothetical protein D3C80_2065240 [compost metagenome]
MRLLLQLFERKVAGRVARHCPGVRQCFSRTLPRIVGGLDGQGFRCTALQVIRKDLRQYIAAERDEVQ